MPSDSRSCLPCDISIGHVLKRGSFGRKAVTQDMNIQNSVLLSMFLKQKQGECVFPV